MSPIIDLIQYRSFGDKLNELTSLIYDYFSTLWHYASWYLLGCSLTFAICFRINFEEDSPYQTLLYYLVYFSYGLLFLIFTVLLRKVCVEGQSFKRTSDFLRGSLGDLGHAIAVSVVPLILFSILGNFLFDILLDIENNFGFFIFGFFVSIILLVPISLYLIIAVFEQKSGFQLFRRTRSLLFCNPFSTAFYFLTIILIGLLIPMISTIPNIVFTFVLSFSVNDFSNSDLMEFIFESYNFLINVLRNLCLIIYLFVIALGTMLHYGHIVEVHDNVRFLSKLNNFDNL